MGDLVEAKPIRKLVHSKNKLNKLRFYELWKTSLKSGTIFKTNSLLHAGDKIHLFEKKKQVDELEFRGKKSFFIRWQTDFCDEGVASKSTVVID